MSNSVSGNITSKLKPGRIAFIRKNADMVRVACIMIASFLVMNMLNPGRFFTANNLRSMMVQFPEIGLLALGAMIAMMSGTVNLSTLAMANLSSLISSFVAKAVEPVLGGVLATIIGVIAAMLTGMVCGYINGVFITKVGIQPLLATLATGQMFIGLGVFITGGAPITGLPAEYALISSTRIWIIPLQLVIYAVVALAYSILLRKTKLGLQISLVGSNVTAARFSGISVEKTKTKVEMHVGFIASISGVVMTSSVMSAKAEYGLSYGLLAILVALIGAVPPSGGFGKVMGIVMASITLQIISTGFNLMRIDAYTKNLAYGSILIVMLLMGVLIDKSSDKRQIRQMYAIEREEAKKNE
jgi:simple sugar transport system permease protein